ncbi:copper homeostasis protein CutC [Brucella intermedia]|uniref:PF03932 family protein CutC n=1 Tax=Brucella intermedia GD04153 TaxID=2975438 RepID=A0AA42H1E2_9HYPH|nr:copper homeostasis protein CutC [Brucella intermedia]PJT21641.1 copper homeostasis protein CutC [Ochrobactrum sp. 30A/1000/2015]PJT39754.1 copper homeostasis protein CutC [Ochrobactrum sp. 27A/999/2015]PJT44048.1 copper homeostasis protein CutC [Ochrobactrum sp. 23A/997/2015]KAB2695116.1 copper homeostasis protein CutC [Brucella intermedia]KAB2709553.1 copper homeostasis protein CutC [Brucella intermedia]
MSVLLEVCVDSAEGLYSAIEGGADRIELCSALELGGLTPSQALMELASTVPIPVYAMIRPRAGSFCFSAEDEVIMAADIGNARNAGLAGVVLGASLADGSLDVTLLERLIAEAKGLGTTLHRAFDLVPDAETALEQAIALGFERILTSGLSQTAEEGLDNLRHLAGKAGKRISIMPGSGVSAGNVGRIIEATGATEVHASCRVAVEEKDSRAIAFGFAGERSFRTSAQRMSELKAAIGHI